MENVVYSSKMAFYLLFFNDYTTTKAFCCVPTFQNEVQGTGNYILANLCLSFMLDLNITWTSPLQCETTKNIHKCFVLAKALTMIPNSSKITLLSCTVDKAVKF